MSDTNRYTGAISIKPPLTYRELQEAPKTQDAALAVVEKRVETETGWTAVMLADAIIADCDAMSGRHFEADMQALVDYVGTLDAPHEFAGHIEVEWDPGYGVTPPSRFMVRDGRVVQVDARIVWPGEDDSALTEARDLAKLALGILDDFPTDASCFDDSLGYENLPTWAGGEAETWQRGDES